MTKSKQKQLIELRDPNLSAKSDFKVDANELIVFGALVFSYYQLGSASFMQKVQDAIAKDPTGDAISAVMGWPVWGVKQIFDLFSPP